MIQFLKDKRIISALTRSPLFYLSTQLRTNYKGQPLLHHLSNLTKHQKDPSLFSVSTSKVPYLHRMEVPTINHIHKKIEIPQTQNSIPSSFKDQQKPKLWNNNHITAKRQIPRCQILLILEIGRNQKKNTNRLRLQETN